MKVKGMIEPDVHASKVGDVIDVKLAGGVKVQAMAVQQEEDDMIFCLVDCLPGEYPMNSTRTNEGGYEESDLLRLPTEKEIFGGNYYGEYESPYVKQWKPMKKRRNRMAFDGTKEENLQWYWLINKVRESAASFSSVSGNGYAHASFASSSYGVRPAFKLKNH